MPLGKLGAFDSFLIKNGRNPKRSKDEDHDLSITLEVTPSKIEGWANSAKGGTSRMERVTGLAPATSSLARKRSTTELHPH